MIRAKLLDCDLFPRPDNRPVVKIKRNSQTFKTRLKVGQHRVGVRRMHHDADQFLHRRLLAHIDLSLTQPPFSPIPSGNNTGVVGSINESPISFVRIMGSFLRPLLDLRPSIS